MANDARWREYEIMATTVRSYMDLVFKLNGFYYAITGAILSFCFSRPTPMSP